MLELIRQVNDEFGINVVLSSHLLEEVERVCDNIVALDAGRLVASGPLRDLIGNDEGFEIELIEIDDRPGAVEAVVASLVAAGLTVRRYDSMLTVIGSDAGFVADSARDAIADAGARLGRMASRRRSLEDLFMEHS